jgi:DNA-binding NarL/FixJ family response regulator
VLAFFASSPGRLSAVPFPELTGRESEVLDLVAHGLSNGTIAQRLVLSEKPVRNRVSDVLTELDAASRAEAATPARDARPGPRADPAEAGQPRLPIRSSSETSSGRDA